MELRSNSAIYQLRIYPHIRTCK